MALGEENPWALKGRRVFEAGTGRAVGLFNEQKDAELVVDLHNQLQDAVRLTANIGDAMRLLGEEMVRQGHNAWSDRCASVLARFGQTSTEEILRQFYGALDS